MQESCAGFADNHDAVHAELERQLSRRELSSRNPRRAAVGEQTPLTNHAGGLEHYRQSQDASEGSELSFDYNQASFAHALQMLDSDPVSLGNSQELTLGLAQEGPATPGFASRLSLSLDDSKESDTGVGENGFFVDWAICEPLSLWDLICRKCKLLDFGWPICGAVRTIWGVFLSEI